MTTQTAVPSATREPQLRGQTVVVLGGSSGIGLAVARLVRAEGADVILTGRNEERLRGAATELGARSSSAFDVSDAAALDRFFADLGEPVDHVMVTAGGPHYARLAEMDHEQMRDALNGHLMLALDVARNAPGRVRPGGSLVLTGGTGARRPAIGLAILSAVTAATPALAASMALELAPIRVNVVAPGFVDTPLSASLLGDRLDERRDELRKTLPIGRVVGPDDVAALAVHLMTNTALTGATYDIDGGQQLLSG